MSWSRETNELSGGNEVKAGRGEREKERDPDEEKESVPKLVGPMTTLINGGSLVALLPSTRTSSSFAL